MSTDTLIRQNVILAAINMTGAVGEVADWDAQVKQNAKKVASLLNENSPINKTLDAIDGSSKFVGTLVHVGLEKKTGRFIAVVKSEKQSGEVTYEGIRTEIGDWKGKEGEVYSFAKSLKDNLGYRYVFFKEMQAGKDPNKKFRCLIHAEQIGHDSRVTDEDYANGKAKFDEVVAS
jgi:hypothetical protein